MAEKNTANIGFEKQIWDAACVLWGHIPAAEYRKVIVGLIFPRGKTRTGSSPVSGTRIKALRSSCDLRAFLGYLSTNFFGIKINFECFKHFNMLV